MFDIFMTRNKKRYFSLRGNYIHFFPRSIKDMNEGKRFNESVNNAASRIIVCA